MHKRIEKLLVKIQAVDLDAVYVTSSYNSRYLTGFTGSSCYVYISKKRRVLLTDFRYIQQATRECPDYEIIDYMTDGLDKTVQSLVVSDDVKKLGLEEHKMTVREYKYYQDVLPEVAFVSIEGVTEKLRMIKEENEINAIRQAAAIADKGFAHILGYIKAGMSELGVALELEFYMKKQGASALSFDIIAASGKRSSLPHGRASEKIIEDGDFLTLDFGCIYEGYCSDMTRTVVVGKADDKQREVYNTVLKAQLAALEAIKAGEAGKGIDKIARDIIYGAGYEGYFGHGLGHSLGLEVHENPRFSSRELLDIEVGMLMTVEPGIYIPNWGGVRIEDLVLVTEDGYENLTTSTKDLLEI